MTPTGTAMSKDKIRVLAIKITVLPKREPITLETGCWLAKAQETPKSPRINPSWQASLRPSATFRL